MPSPSRSEASNSVALTRVSLAWVTVLTGGLVLCIGLLGYVFREPWLFASMGPSALLHARSPEDEQSTFYNTLAGHIVAVAGALVAVDVFDASRQPLGDLSLLRVWAAAFGIALTVLGQFALKAYHAPAASTTLLLTLGTIAPTPYNIAGLTIGVTLLSLLGEAIRRLRLRQVTRAQRQR